MSVTEKQQRLLDECLDSIKHWHDLIKKYSKENEKLAALDTLQEATKIYCSTRLDAERQDDALKRIENHMDESQADTNFDVESMFKTLVEQSEIEYNLVDSETWNKVFDGEDVQVVAQIKDRISDSHFVSLNDSIMCSEVFKVPVDPLTKQKIQEPYRNRNCGHVYEFKFILEYIKNMKRKAKCPYVGCGNQQLITSDLVKDEELQTKIMEYIQNSN